MKNRILRKDIFAIVDLLAHEYGWPIEYIDRILDTDEIMGLQAAIAVRRQIEFKTLAYVINCALRGKMPKFDASDDEVDDQVYESTDRTRTPEQFEKLMQSFGAKLGKEKDSGTEAEGTDS